MIDRFDPRPEDLQVGEFFRIDTVVLVFAAVIRASNSARRQTKKMRWRSSARSGRLSAG